MLSIDDALWGRANLRADIVGMCDQHLYSERYGGASIALTTDLAIKAWMYLNLRGEYNLVIRGADSQTVKSKTVVSADSFDPEDRDFGLFENILNRFPGLKPHGVAFSSETMTPAGCGLGTGSAVAYLCAAMAAAWQQKLDPNSRQLTNRELAELTIEVENQSLKSRYGWQDQWHMSQDGVVKFLQWQMGEKRPDIESIRLGSKTVEQIEQRFVLFFTGLSRSAKDVLNRVTEGVEQANEEVIKALDQLKELCWNVRQLLLNHKLDLIGAALQNAWTCHRMLHPSVTNPEIERFIEVGQKAGAMAARVCGAGGGGVLMFWCPPDNSHRVKVALNEAGRATGGQILECRLIAEPIRLGWEE